MSNNHSTASEKNIDKLAIYREILEIDPSSRAFFLYAQLLEQEENIDEALTILAKGLEKHPDYLEARLYYIDLLSRHDKIESAQIQLSQFTDIIKKYPAFWTIWSKLAEEENTTISSTLALLSTFFSNPSLTFMEVLQAGIYHLSGSTQKQEVKHFPPKQVAAIQEVIKNDEGQANLLVKQESAVYEEFEKEADDIFTYSQEENFDEEVHQEDASSYESSAEYNFAQESENTNYSAKTSTHTRSMADLLAEQGDLDGAIEIYAELLECAKEKNQFADLKKRMLELEELRDHPHTRHQAEATIKEVVSEEPSNSHAEEAIIEDDTLNSLDIIENQSENTVQQEVKESKKQKDALSPKMLDMLENLASRLEKRASTS